MSGYYICQLFRRYNSDVVHFDFTDKLSEDTMKTAGITKEKLALHDLTEKSLRVG